MIRNNAHKYSVLAMCDVLNLPKSTYYYPANLREREAHEAEETELSEDIQRIFKESRNNYGTRKIKKELEKQEKKKVISRRRISRTTPWHNINRINERAMKHQ